MTTAESVTTEVDCPHCDRGQIPEISWTSVYGGSAGRRTGLTTACPVCQGMGRCTRTVYQDADLILHKVPKNKGGIPMTLAKTSEGPVNDPKKPAPIPDDVLAKAIVKISEGMQRLVSSGLNRDAVVILLHHETKLPFRDINRILDELTYLARKYTTNSARQS